MSSGSAFSSEKWAGRRQNTVALKSDDRTPNPNTKAKMNVKIIRTTFAVAAIGCLGFTAARASGSGGHISAGGKRPSPVHQSSSGTSRHGKSSSERNSRSSDSRGHARHRASNLSSRAHDRLPNASSFEETRGINAPNQPDDVNDQAELPRRESEDENDQESNDANGILMGTGAENGGG